VGRPTTYCCNVNLRDPTNLLQQEAIGILGVNLIYAAFHQSQTSEHLVESVAQDVENRIEIDHVDLRGPAFETWDRRMLLVNMVHAGLAEVVSFPSSSSPVPHQFYATQVARSYVLISNNLDDLHQVSATLSWSTPFRRARIISPSFAAWFTACGFATIGLSLVVIGVFSVMAYSVSLQTHEVWELEEPRSSGSALRVQRNHRSILFGSYLS
jgi:hypothetical protein